jgi:NAD(P)-dependent dehydrogenase (short-subunit alcohol dehydrogenase family)
MGDVKPKVVLITGASSGIGQACARHLARRGYQVFGTSRRPQPGAEESFEMIPMDVTDEDSVRQGVATVLARAGRLDVVVNNAGFGFGGAVEDTSIDEAQELFETNFFGMLRVCRAVLPHMRERRAGTIVNISSLAGLIGQPFVGMYCATKFATEGVTEALRMEVRPFGIRVVMIEPGDTQTAFTANRRPTQASQAASPYADNMQRTLAVIEHDENTGASPETVARLLDRVLRSRSPRLRYPVANPSQRFAAMARKLMPGGLFERLLTQYYRVR